MRALSCSVRYDIIPLKRHYSSPCSLCSPSLADGLFLEHADQGPSVGSVHPLLPPPACCHPPGGVCSAREGFLTCLPNITPLASHPTSVSYLIFLTTVSIVGYTMPLFSLIQLFLVPRPQSRGRFSGALGDKRFADGDRRSALGQQGFLLVRFTAVSSAPRSGPGTRHVRRD